MDRTRIAYMPLNSYPDAIPAEPVQAAVGMAGAMGLDLHVATLAVDVPPLNPPLGSLVLNIPDMARQAEERSRAECSRLAGLVRQAQVGRAPEIEERPVRPGGAPDAAAEQARYFDLSLLPWASEVPDAPEMAQAVIFGSGRPVLVVPAGARVHRIDHLAIAWDGSRVAARALGDALELVPQGCRVTVLTIEGEKPLGDKGMAATLAAALERRGFAARAHGAVLGYRGIAEALQDEALQVGASLLAMGGFGHSRLRDFILGGATEGVFLDLRLPVLLSH